MMELLLAPSFWAALFSVTLIQIALGADNLIIITIIANLPGTGNNYPSGGVKSYAPPARWVRRATQSDRDAQRERTEAHPCCTTSTTPCA
jgi:hypothetical protein